jgi:hypothetical protein
LGQARREIFLKAGLDRPNQVDLVGQITQSAQGDGGQISGADASSEALQNTKAFEPVSARSDQVNGGAMLSA